MKQKTKAQREAAAKKALLQRVTDVYSGALGEHWDGDQFATAEILSRVIPALHELFNDQWHDFMSRPHCLDRYDTAETAAEFLYSNGVRAKR